MNEPFALRHNQSHLQRNEPAVISPLNQKLLKMVMTGV